MNDDLATPVPVADVPPARHRGGPRYAVLVLGLVAAIVLGGSLLRALTGGGGGAESAEDAVRSLAEAIADEDLLAALKVIAPEEVGSLDRAVNTAFGKAEEYGIVESAARPFAGFDLRVHDLDLHGEEMAPGFVKVSITGGRIDAEMHPEELAEPFRDRPGIQPDSTSVDVREVLCEDGCPGDTEHPFLVAVENDGRWYVSVTYTAFEYWRLSERLPEPDLGSARRISSTGAESPEAALESLLEAVKTLDMERIGSLVPPGELGAVYDYHAAIKASVEQHNVELPLFDSDGLTFAVARDGAEAEVTIESGTIRYGDPESSETTMKFSGDGCADVTHRFTYSESTAEAFGTGGDLAGEGIDSEGIELPAELGTGEVELLEQFGVDLEGGATDEGGSSIDEMRYSTCDEAGALDVTLLPGQIQSPTAIRAIERDGRWYVSLVGTLVDSVGETFQRLDRRFVYLMFDLPHRIDPDGAVTIGESVEGEVKSFADLDVWSFQGRAGDEIVVRVEAEGSGEGLFPGDEYVYPSLYDPYGEPVWEDYFAGGQLFNLRDDGEHRIIVQGVGKYTLRVEKAEIPELPVPGTANGRIENSLADDVDPWSTLAIYAVVVPEGTRVRVTADSTAVTLDAMPAPGEDLALDEAVEIFGFGTDSGTVTLDGSEATRWRVTVMPSYDESWFGPDGEPTPEAPRAFEFTLTTEVVDGG